MSNMLRHAQRPLTFNNSDLKFRDLAKLCFFKLIMTKSKFKNSYNVISVTSAVTEKRHQNNVTIFSDLPFLPSKFLATPLVCN